MKKYVITSLIALIFTTSVSFSQAPPNYDLIWNDEFDQPRNSDGTLPLPGDKWWFETGGSGWGNNELQYYVDRPIGNDTVAKIQDGKLIITAHKLSTPYQGKNYLSARMNSSGSWKYGYFEMRAKLPGGRGTWAAFWMMPKNFNNWPLDGEIDILEYVGYRPKVVQSTIHTQAYNHMIQTDKSGLKTIETAETEFHTYGLEWTKDKIIGYADGEPYFVFENDGTGNKHTWPFNEPFYLKLNLAIGGDWGGLQGIDNSIFPSRYEIDYVRVYEKNTPTAEFRVKQQIGFSPVSIPFQNLSLKATEYLWDFGDGTISTEKDPVHTYSSPGTYTVTLTAKNMHGEEKIEKKNIITLIEPVQLTAGGIINGGNMENGSVWQTSYLNSVSDGLPVATWNYTGQKPTAGQGGALNIQGGARNGASVFCFFQKVQVSKDYVYRFDAAIRDLSDSLSHFFTEVYISETAPGNISDFKSGVKIAYIESDEYMNSIYPGMDATFQLHGNVTEFIPEKSGEYFLVVKVGALDMKGNKLLFNVLVDELSLVPHRTRPYTNFSAENYQGLIPLDVTFRNETKFGNEYLWDFGDGNTLKTPDAEVEHTYNQEGVYTVSLKAENEIGDSIFVRENYIVTGSSHNRVPGEKLLGGNMENGAFWKIATLNADFPTSLTWNYREKMPQNGEGGCLRLNAVSRNGESNIAIYQEVDLHKDSVYNFDCSYRDLGASNHLWAQVYIDTEEPSNTKDLNIKEDYTIGQLNTWVNPRVVGYDGEFSALATKGNRHELNVCEYKPKITGKHYFIFKVGNTDWENVDYELDIALDELSLRVQSSNDIEDGHYSDTLNVYSYNRKIEIKSENIISKINIYNLSGLLVESSLRKTNHYVSHPLVQGIYIVEVNNASFKVIVK